MGLGGPVRAGDWGRGQQRRDVQHVARGFLRRLSPFWGDCSEGGVPAWIWGGSWAAPPRALPIKRWGRFGSGVFSPLFGSHKISLPVRGSAAAGLIAFRARSRREFVCSSSNNWLGSN